VSLHKINYICELVDYSFFGEPISKPVKKENPKDETSERQTIMITVNIKLVFPYGNFTPSRFKMELPSVPKAGDGISFLDYTFGPKLDAFIKMVETKFRLVGGCQPQYVQTVFYVNGSYLITVSCNPNNNLLVWDSLRDGKTCILGTSIRPQKGDWFYDDRDKAVCIANVIYEGDNRFALQISEDGISDNAAIGDMAYDINSIANDVRDIAKRVDDIYYQGR